MVNRFLKCIKILPKILWSALAAWLVAALVLWQTNLHFWQVCWTLIPQKKAHVLFVFAIVLISHYWYLKMSPAFCLAPTRNGMLLSPTGPNYYTRFAKPQCRG